MPIDIPLSIEEIAVAIGAEGDPQTASNILVSQFGKLSKGEMEGRLYSAIHALMALGYLSSMGDGNVQNSSELKEVAGILLKVDYTVRFHLRDKKDGYLLAYHFRGKKVFEHRQKQKVVHHIKEVNKESVITGGLDFYRLNNSGDFDFTPCVLPIDALKLFQSGEKTEAMLGYLEKHEIPVAVRTALVEDITATEFRASALRVDYDKKNMPYSNQGFLLLHGLERHWIFLPEKKNGGEYLSLLPGNSKNFQKLVSGLIAARPQKKVRNGSE